MQERDFRTTAGAVAIAVAVLTTAAAAQAPPVNGMRPADLRAHAIVDAQVVVAPGRTLERATVVIRDGVIERVGVDAEVPADARVWSGEGLTVYAGLIDAAVLVKADDEPASVGDHWNKRVRPQRTLETQTAPSASLRKSLRSMGFTVAAVYPDAGLFRGTGTVVALAEADAEVLAYRPRAAMSMAFDYGGRWGRATYPGSLMGAMALIRQTFDDARWHAVCRAVYAAAPERHEPPIRADALVALQDVLAGRQAVLWEVSDEHNALRAARLVEEYELDATLLGSGTEFRRLDDVVGTGLPLIIPLEFPKRPELNTLAQADRVTLRDMMAWEQAPTNVRRLLDAGATVALTTHKLDKRSAFPKQLRTAIKYGLDADAALAALTVTPARMLGLEDVLGTVEPGKSANLVVVDGDLFDKKAKIRDVWINGRRSEITAVPTVQFAARGTLETGVVDTLELTIDTKKSTATLHLPEDKTLKAKKLVAQQDRISFILDGDPFEVKGFVRFSGVLSDEVITGRGVLPDGNDFVFTFTATGDAGDPPADAAADTVAEAETDGETETETHPLDGTWDLALAIEGVDEAVPGTMTLTTNEDGSVTGTGSALEAVVRFDSGTLEGDALVLNWTDDGGGTLEATIDGNGMSGSVLGEGIAANFTATRGDTVAAADAGDDAPVVLPPEELLLPLGAYGLTAPPEPRDFVIENATIWTCGDMGIVEGGSILVRDGRIVGVYDSPRSPAGARGLERIDGTGKHVTPGLIDCHSHTGISGGVNEWAQTNSAEVRIGDCISPDDVNWYRQLAGGLTAANQLHGSANPIGGQNSVVKLKWGGPAATFPIDDAIGGIKFALGENVKRSENRYPDTRMGVETFIRDAFTAATHYRDALTAYEALPSDERRMTMPPQPDLELQTLVEILEGERLIHCHSYRQDEILALIRIADDFGFTIGTFQHVLEGYKVAEAIAAHGAGGSSFSDWWAYKMEVYDAIPYNGALMTEVGVTVSFNSDSSELARRMNTEAAKAVRYGGMDPHEALKLVSLNPAKQLRVDDRIGSLEAGKDADLVIWSGDPLSTYTICEKTFVEGACYFDRDADLALRERDAAERQRLVQKILADAHPAGGKDKKKRPKAPDAEDDPGVDRPVARRGRGRLMARLIDARRAWMEEQVRLGGDPDEIVPGRCACSGVWWMLNSGAGSMMEGE